MCNLLPLAGASMSQLFIEHWDVPDIMAGAGDVGVNWGHDAAQGLGNDRCQTAGASPAEATPRQDVRLRALLSTPTSSCPGSGLPPSPAALNPLPGSGPSPRVVMTRVLSSRP